MRRRAEWLTWYVISAVIGFGVITARRVQAVFDARTCWRPTSYRVIAAIAREHADEYAGGGRCG